MQIFGDILPFVGVQLDRERFPTVTMSDSPLEGYAIHFGAVVSGAAFELSAYTERWKFEPERHVHACGEAVQQASFTAGGE